MAGSKPFTRFPSLRESTTTAWGSLDITRALVLKRGRGVRYADRDHMGFGQLRVLNEDRVESGTGFGTHPHREFEIFSYVVDGELEQCVFRSSFLIRGHAYTYAGAFAVRTPWETLRC